MDIPSKKEIRKYIVDMRDKISAEQKCKWDSKINDILVNSEFYKNAGVIFTFVSFRSEVDTHWFIKHAIEDKKIICVPKVVSKQEGMETYIIKSMSDLRAGYYGILEPVDKCPKVIAEDIDLVLVPGLAFDREGRRLGYGGGFYDRFLRRMRGKTPNIALAYHFQIINTVPADQWDIKMDAIITDEEQILTNKIV